ncbi:hypothetical protein [Methylobacterium indicum]|uniref:hypothetical protein n=1 Tax=Methylobacterium indicum TaxID=1775910 RepID=UPI0024359F48|nr:hypothetical protein [Methylobacterium indicum]
MMIDLDKELDDNLAPGPQNELDPLQLLTESTEALADIIVRTYSFKEYRVERPEFELFRKAAKLLKINARHVPRSIDQVIDYARSHGGLQK